MHRFAGFYPKTEIIAGEFVGIATNMNFMLKRLAIHLDFCPRIAYNLMQGKRDTSFHRQSAYLRFPFSRSGNGEYAICI